MAGNLLFNAVGFLASAFGIVQFSTEVFADTKPEGASVRVKAGVAKIGDTGASLGGEISHAYAFSLENQYNGQSGGCKLGEGGVCDLTIDQNTSGLRADFVAVSNANDATCIAWISVKQFDNTFGGVWTGDIGWKCGQNWYESREIAGKTEAGDEYIPKCTWLDGDHTNEIKSAALKFNTRAHGDASGETVTKDVCSFTIWGNDNGPISGAPAKRDVKDRAQWMNEQLVISHHAGQSAAGLCSSATSLGPDFIGQDGNFCDMATKTLIPLCSSKDVDGCVEIDVNAKTVTKRMSVAKRSANIIHKSYKHTDIWGA